MRTLLLTWRYIMAHKLKSTILTVCVTATCFLPLAVHVMIEHYQRDLMARASATPLILGAKGNRYDLVLKSLYFTAENPEPIVMGSVYAVRDTGWASVLPLHVLFTARGNPIVGTTLDYFEFRRLKPAEGTFPLRIGDAVLGAAVAESLELHAGDWIITDQTSLYDIAAVYPLRMRVTGVLKPTGTADDHAVFVDVKTAWIIEGIGHGHTDLAETTDEQLILEARDGEVVGSPAVLEYTEITPANIAAFHFHGDASAFPLTAALVVPNDAKSGTLLMGRLGVSPTEQLLVPVDVVDELMGIVFQIKRFFDAAFAVICASTVLFVTLVVLLSLRIRRREMETMFKIGCSRLTIVRLQAAELGVIVVISLLVSTVLLAGLILFVPDLMDVM
jgi:putative ABC transport system permease protein